MHAERSHSIHAIGARAIVVMGVSAAGKSSVAAGLSQRLGLPWIDADNLHPAANITKMSRGIPLQDEDRWPWLDAVGRELAGRGSHPGLIVACSALRRAYRDRLRAAQPATRFIHLTASHVVLASRAASRENHFMPPTLLNSQLAALEPLQEDEAGTVIDVTGALSAVVDRAAEGIDTP